MNTRNKGAGYGLKLAVALVAAATLGGCVVEREPEIDPDIAPASLAERACPPDSFVTWEDFGAPFMYTYCNGCHSSALPQGERQDAPLGVDFDTIEDVRYWADRIWARSADHNVTMPPVGGPEYDERDLLGEWLACGALSRDDM